jgi:hypothetical protein
MMYFEQGYMVYSDGLTVLLRYIASNERAMKDGWRRHGEAVMSAPK